MSTKTSTINKTKTKTSTINKSSRNVRYLKRSLKKELIESIYFRKKCNVLSNDLNYYYDYSINAYNYNCEILDQYNKYVNFVEDYKNIVEADYKNFVDEID